MKILKSRLEGYVTLKRKDKDGRDETAVLSEAMLHELFETVFGGEMFSKIVELQKLMWADDDCMSWETLVDAQNTLSEFALTYAGKLNLGGLNPKHVDLLCEQFPWLYEVQEKKGEA